MTCKAEVSYYPSYVEIDAIHQIDPEISGKEDHYCLCVYDEFLTDIREDFEKREGTAVCGGFASIR